MYLLTLGLGKYLGYGSYVPVFIDTDTNITFGGSSSSMPIGYIELLSEMRRWTDIPLYMTLVTPGIV